MIKFNTVCPRCRKTYIIEVRAEDWLKWKFGVNTQIAFPYLSPVEREMFITGICGDCWKKMFGEEEEEDEDE